MANYIWFIFSKDCQYNFAFNNITIINLASTATTAQINTSITGNLANILFIKSCVSSANPIFFN